jgi:hypothetical protein
MRVCSLVCFFVACLSCLGAPPKGVPPPLHPKEVRGPRDDPGPGVDIDYRGGRVTRRDGAGQLLWSVQVASNLLGVRDPHVLHDAERLYLGHAEGLTALDLKTGKVAWQVKDAASDRLHLSGKLLLATECSIGEQVQQGCCQRGPGVQGRPAPARFRSVADPRSCWSLPRPGGRWSFLQGRRIPH